MTKPDETRDRLAQILVIMEQMDAKLDVLERDANRGRTQIGEIRNLALAGCARLDAIIVGWGE